MQSYRTIVCRKCQFYFVTWDQRRPHGCRAMNFMSRRPPSLVVRQNSGQDCLRYTPKEAPENGHKQR